ncbi:sulfotransferase [Sphingomonas sp. ASV193]|uniref:tetratricopeptide repeat-containing sulfotransferase family protein n=1 Tax=Sphingomonas sp. ASV193 TaxID=3144405 RepID=UPI0032E864BA
MISTLPDQPYFVQALAALKDGDRRRAAAFLERQLEGGRTSRRNLDSVSRLAASIGEIDLAIEAAREAIDPDSLPSLLPYWSLLATFGRSAEAVADLERRPAAWREDAAVLHFLATVESQFGRRERTEDLFRRALAIEPDSRATWFALSMLKTFEPGDPDIPAMERLAPLALPGSHDSARLMYALGKAWSDIGETDRAFEYYQKGASLQPRGRPIDLAGLGRAADRTIADFGPRFADRLVPSGFEGRPALFVTGLPRSGTSITEQILRSHSAVRDGAELNLFSGALIPSRGSLAGALGYQQRSGTADPWGEIARDYADLANRYFRSGDLIVDKSLGQSLLIGLMLHAMPRARIAWLRRAPDDVALSCFQTYFGDSLPWTGSLTDIADHMLIEDRLYRHWQSIFPNRILTVPYEDLVADPSLWAIRLQRHFGLEIETGLDLKSREGRAIRTASTGQAHAPITTRRIGRSAAYARHMKPFRDRYERGVAAIDQR